jgi:hypothetical protein
MTPGHDVRPGIPTADLQKIEGSCDKTGEQLT